MDADERLKVLGVRKAEVRARIAARRSECAAAAAGVAERLAFPDLLLARWQRLPRSFKAVGVPLAVVATRFALRRFGFRAMRRVLAAAPAAYGIARSLLRARF